MNCIDLPRDLHLAHTRPATIAGDDRRCLTPPGRYAAPAWSPSGTRLAYAAGGATGWDVFVLPAAGGAARNLSRHAGLNGAPSWASGGLDAALGRWWARLVR